MSVEIIRCPFCNGSEFVIAYQDAYGALTGESIWTGAKLNHQICRTCGSVVRSYVDKPEKLLKRKNRKKED